MIDKKIVSKFLNVLNNEFNLSIQVNMSDHKVHLNYNNIDFIIQSVNEEQIEASFVFNEIDILDALCRFRLLISEIQNRKLPNVKRHPDFKDLDIHLLQEMPDLFKTDYAKNILITY